MKAHSLNVLSFSGYANEVGEAFRSMIPVSLVRSTYIVALGYATADALDKSHKAHKVLYKVYNICLFIYNICNTLYNIFFTF